MNPFNTVRNIFDAFSLPSHIFKNREVLRSTYVPDYLPHRQREIAQIASILAPALRGETPTNLLIYGKPGTGKTASTNFIGRALEEKASEITRRYLRTYFELLKSIDDGTVETLWEASEVVSIEEVLGEEFFRFFRRKVHYIYVNCQQVDTGYRLIAHLANHFARDWNERVPISGWSPDTLYRKFLERLEREGGVTVVVLDEIDRLVAKSGDEVLYTLTRIGSDLKEAKLSIVGISNDLKFTDMLDSRVKSSLGGEEMVFPPYNAEQLRDILRQRAEMAFQPGVLDDGVIPLCAAMAAQEFGDARRALELLKVSGEIAERLGEKRVTEEHVREAQRRIEEDRIGEVIRTLPNQPKLVLFTILQMRRFGGGERRITSGEIYDNYRFYAEKVGLRVLTSRRVSEFISELSILGLIDARVVSFGRQGRTKVIDVKIPIRKSLDTLTEGIFRDIKEMPPRYAYRRAF
ncbi:MAG: orc1/cdc6 family replication initiation protein [Thermoplasmata archaeon]|nr:orc1/cdc6 family replication initiation protein [Thermoplasmata archaeon]